MSRRPSRGLVVAAFVLLVLSAGVNVLQAQKIRSLLEFQSTPVSAVGKRAGSVQGFSTAGIPREVNALSDRPTVLYFFSPTCGWCERNWANIKALSEGANGRYRLVAVTAARGVQSYLATHNLSLDVVEGITDDSRRAFGFSGTPHTIVISSEGLITHDWRGAFTPRVERQVEELFGLVLPGVAPAPK